MTGDCCIAQPADQLLVVETRNVVASEKLCVPFRSGVGFYETKDTRHRPIKNGWQWSLAALFLGLPPKGQTLAYASLKLLEVTRSLPSGFSWKLPT